MSSTIPQAGPTGQLTAFSNLAPELRLKIWGEALLNAEERVIMLKLFPIPGGQRYGVITPPTPPVLLHVCQESREEALKVYERMELDCSLTREPVGGGTVELGHKNTFRLYFNSARDMFRLCG